MCGFDDYEKSHFFERKNPHESSLSFKHRFSPFIEILTSRYLTVDTAEMGLCLNSFESGWNLIIGLLALLLLNKVSVCGTLNDS